MNMNLLAKELIKIARTINANDVKVENVKDTGTEWVEPNGDRMHLWTVTFVQNGQRDQLQMAATDKSEAQNKTIEFLNSVANN